MIAEPLPSAVEPDRLTEVFGRAGGLQRGRVSNVEVLHSRTTVLSRITRLRITHEGNDSGAPSSLILKTGLPERVGNASWDAGRQEVAFYTDVAAAMLGVLVPRCFEATWDAETRAWHLLLEDLTDSHFIATV
jgi:hypothetical protein